MLLLHMQIPVNNQKAAQGKKIWIDSGTASSLFELSDPDHFRRSIHNNWSAVRLTAVSFNLMSLQYLAFDGRFFQLFVTSVRPKEFTAEISVNFRPKQLWHYWQVSAIRECIRPKVFFSAETDIFGRKKLVSAKILQCRSFKLVLLFQGTTNFPIFGLKLRPKLPFSNENGSIECK